MVPSSCVHYASVNSNSALKEAQLAIPSKSGPIFAKGVYTLGKGWKCMSIKFVTTLPFKVLAKNSVVIQIINSQFSAL